jgi:hypothetical protein
LWADGRQIQKSSGSRKRQDAVRLRDQGYCAKRFAASLALLPSRVTCGKLLDDLLEHAKTNFKASTEKITRLVIEASIRPFFRPPESRESDHGGVEGIPPQTR